MWSYLRPLRIFYVPLADINPVFTPVCTHCSHRIAERAEPMNAVNTLHMVYGVGAICAALLFVYLVYALVRAEDF